jgi:hypothetical protein
MHINCEKVTKNKPLFILLLLLFLTFFPHVSGQTIEVGVKPGNTFEYTYNFSWISTDPKLTIPQEYVELKNTQLLKITIKSVSGTLINMNITRRLSNGTEITQNGNTDVDKQTYDIPYSFLVIRANTNPGEKMYPAGGRTTLGEVSTRTYPIGQVETIQYNKTDTSNTRYQKSDVYFDRSTGIAMEYQYEYQEISTSYTTTIKETIILQRSNITEKTGDIKIIILDSSSQPISGVSIASITQPEGQNSLSGETGSDGTITFNGVKSGDYTIHVSKNGYTTLSNSAKVVAGSELVIEVTLFPQSSGSSGGGIPGYPTLSIILAVIIVSILTYRSRH